MVQKTFSSDFNRDLEWYIFLKIATIRIQKSFAALVNLLLIRHNDVKTFTYANAKMLHFFVAG